MINQFALNKALLDKLLSVSTDDISVFGDGYEPSPNDDYLAEKEIPTGETGTVSTNTVTRRGFYQVTVCTPIGKGKFYALAKADSLKNNFTIGMTAGIEFNGQKVSISTVESSSVYADETHLKVALTINYTVIA